MHRSSGLVVLSVLFIVTRAVATADGDDFDVNGLASSDPVNVEPNHTSGQETSFEMVQLASGIVAFFASLVTSTVMCAWHRRSRASSEDGATGLEADSSRLLEAKVDGGSDQESACVGAASDGFDASCVEIADIAAKIAAPADKVDRPLRSSSKHGSRGASPVPTPEAAAAPLCGPADVSAAERDVRGLAEIAQPADRDPPRIRDALNVDTLTRPQRSKLSKAARIIQRLFRARRKMRYYSAMTKAALRLSTSTNSSLRSSTASVGRDGAQPPQPFSQRNSLESIVERLDLQVSSSGRSECSSLVGDGCWLDQSSTSTSTLTSSGPDVSVRSSLDLSATWRNQGIWRLGASKGGLGSSGQWCEPGRSSPAPAFDAPPSASRLLRASMGGPGPAPWSELSAEPTPGDDLRRKRSLSDPPVRTSGYIPQVYASMSVLPDTRSGSIAMHLQAASNNLLRPRKAKRADPAIDSSSSSVADAAPTPLLVVEAPLGAHVD